MDGTSDQQTSSNLPPMPGSNKPAPNSGGQFPFAQPNVLPVVDVTRRNDGQQIPAPIFTPPVVNKNQNDQASNTNRSSSNEYGLQGAQAKSEGAESIPKEWIAKAKIIIEQTKTDPYQQNLRFNKLKADYVKKYYDMTIKVDGE